MYLVDTNIISELAPTKRRENRVALEGWFRRRSDELFLSAVTIAEIEHGIVRLERDGATDRATRLRHWIDAVEALYGDRILPFDRRAARLAGAMMDSSRAHAPGFADIVIAATAAAHDLMVLTANGRHFGPLGVRHADPFEQLPD